jgi:hypothetical protein
MKPGMRQAFLVFVLIALSPFPLSAQGPPPGPASPAQKQLLMTTLGTCYEVDPDFKDAIAKAVEGLRTMIRSQSANGKLIAYISIPLTSRSGGYRPLNLKISEFMKTRVESRFKGNVWALAPGKPETELGDAKGKSAAGGEYMYMWTQLLAGDDGLGRDFDLLFVTGPSDFAAYFAAFFGSSDDPFGALQKYIDDLAKTDKDFRDKIATVPEARKQFLKYYGTKASAAFSDGSHDEWNLFVELKRRRRDSKNAFRIPTGLGEQIPMYFDGRSLNGAEMETMISPGYEKPCPSSR